MALVVLAVLEAILLPVLDTDAAAIDSFPAPLGVPFLSTAWALSELRVEAAFDGFPLVFVAGRLATTGACSDTADETRCWCEATCTDGEAGSDGMSAAERSLIGSAALTGVADGAIHEGGS